MGQEHCCESHVTPTHLMNPNVALKLLNVQDDPV